jgi:hypothetical protein
VSKHHQKRTTIRVSGGASAETIAASLLGFTWLGGPYFLELAGNRGSIQVWAANKGEAERFISKMLEIGGYPPDYAARCVRTERLSDSPRVQTVRRFGLSVRDGLAMVSDRQGSAGSPAYPVVLDVPGD